MKGERDRLGRTRRRLADGIRLPCPSTFAESVPHNAKVWGTHHPGSFSGRPGLDSVSEEPGSGQASAPRAPRLHSAFCILPSAFPHARPPKTSPNSFVTAPGVDFVRPDRIGSAWLGAKRDQPRGMDSF